MRRHHYHEELRSATAVRNASKPQRKAGRSKEVSPTLQALLDFSAEMLRVRSEGITPGWMHEHYVTLLKAHHATLK